MSPFSHGPLAYLVHRQHGMIARRQALAAGVRPRSLDRLLARGHLLKTRHRGVYAVGHYAQAPMAEEMAAILALGRGAVLSHRSAGAYWGLCERPRGFVEVIRPRCGATKLAGVKSYRIETLQQDEWLMVGAMPVTTVARTLLDLAAVLSKDQLASAFSAADRTNRIQVGAIRRLIEPGRRRGAAALRAVFVDYDPQRLPQRSEFESLIWNRIQRRRDFETPERNEIVNGREVDLVWWRKRLMVELDGHRHHSGIERFNADRSRDLEMALDGYQVLRISWAMFRADPDGVLDSLAKILRDLPDLGEPAEGP